MKLIIYSIYVLSSLIALMGECVTENTGILFLYYAFWLANAFIASNLFNKEIKKHENRIRK